MADKYLDRDGSHTIGVRVDHHAVSGEPLDPTSYTVTIAVRPEGTRPGTGDFKAAAWHTGDDGTHWAQLEVGVGTEVGALTAGVRYKAHAKVLASSETPRVTSPDTIVIR